ncbi:MAG: hypothetical protein A2289_18355 [Deltaproteobacteria bacterium RIFOXYA12_FULL_58_15]|nr:MAG: hypothetical protein A2289_18355 [Deltaproteobacteria bacterium RIFOXYA12_FULL_58_15]OGR15093.1 MAG: hypothetical protein A2341_03795 [Deltaproteobacteria bacterium RIFOXYB12_FULL_58_9]
MENLAAEHLRAGLMSPRSTTCKQTERKNILPDLLWASTKSGEAAQTTWKNLRDGRVGNVRLVYADLDDGMIQNVCKYWWNKSGAQWPAADEFRTGCTYEHAGYYLHWLLAFFGPVRKVASFASLLVPDKLTGQTPAELAPDFTVAHLYFDHDIIARLTCSVVGSHNHQLSIFGDDGSLFVDEAWDFWSDLWYLPPLPRRLKKKLKLGSRPPLFSWNDVANKGQRMNYAVGVEDLADAIASDRRPRLCGEMGAHVVEVLEAIQYPPSPEPVIIRSRCPPMQPLG